MTYHSVHTSRRFICCIAGLFPSLNRIWFEKTGRMAFLLVAHSDSVPASYPRRDLVQFHRLIRSFLPRRHLIGSVSVSMKVLSGFLCFGLASQLRTTRLARLMVRGE